MVSIHDELIPMEQLISFSCFWEIMVIFFKLPFSQNSNSIDSPLAAILMKHLCMSVFELRQTNRDTFCRF